MKRTTVYLTIFLIGASLMLGVISQYSRIKEITTKYSIAQNNLKSEKLKTVFWKDEYRKSYSKSIQQIATPYIIRNSDDSTISRYKTIISNMNLELSKTKSIASLSLQIKHDTMIVIKNKTGCHDLSNKYVTNTVCVTDSSIRSSFILDNNMTAVWSSHKETIDPPSKIFFIRWFQKKQEIIEVTVQNENPYLITTSQDFIYIQK